MKIAKQVKKRFKPSQRAAKRYLVVVLYGKKTFGILRNVIKEACNAEARLICYNEKKSKVMVCVQRRYLNEIKAALKINGFNCIGISGMIKRAGQKWMKEG